MRVVSQGLRGIQFCLVKCPELDCLVRRGAGATVLDVHGLGPEARIHWVVLQLLRQIALAVNFAVTVYKAVMHVTLCD